MNAVIYCRVSSRDQVDGTSLESQESACREYAQRHALTISRVFIEEGESAKFADRTELLNLLSYCKEKSRKVEVLLVWKIDRFARNVEDHYTIKATLRRLGVGIVSVTEPIASDPNGQLMETILAGFAQFDNEIRAVRSVQGMKQRLREGIFPWKPPIGYLPPRIGKKTRPDMPDPRTFEPIQKAWKLFLTGAYTKMDIFRLLRTWGVNGYRGRPVCVQLVDQIFRNPYYAGVLQDPWSGEEYVGRHSAMVTPVEFARVQEIVAGRSQAPTHHHRLREEFPLRGLVRCPSCEHTMTATFCRGSTKRYAYYQCFRRNCPTRTRSYPAAAVHDEFFESLAHMSVPRYLSTSLVSHILSAYSTTAGEIRKAVLRRKAVESDLQRQLDELISMRAAKLLSDEEFVSQRARFQKRLYALRAEEQLNDENHLTEDDARSLVESLADLDGLWRASPLAAKRAFTEVLFPAGYVYQRIRTF